jgi:DNA polymerase III sliding clamp (beta) subunit (PCNA family)
MTAVELDTSTISAPAEVLRSVLRAALMAADEYSHPGLMGVLLHGDTHNGEPVLVATATDRFMLAQIHLRAHGHLPTPVFLPTGAVEVAIAGIEPFGTVTITATDKTVTFKSVINQLTVARGENSFPKTVAKLMAGHTPSAEPVSLDPHLLRRLSKIAKRLGRDSVRIGLSEPREPLVAYIGDMARVLVMPRLEHSRRVVSEPPVFNPFPKSVAVAEQGEGGEPK